MLDKVQIDDLIEWLLLITFSTRNTILRITTDTMQIITNRQPRVDCSSKNVS